MRIGFYSGEVVEEEGGAYTFIEELLLAIEEYGGETGHSFIVFSWNKAARELPKHVEYVLLDQEALASSKTDPGVNLELAAAKTLIESDVEVIFYPTMYNCPTMDIPFFTIAWDLQHRLQPFFPEVSVNWWWLSREKMLPAALRRAFAVIAGTEAGKSEIIDFFQVPADRIKILPHPTPSFTLNEPVGDNGEILDRNNIPPGYLFYPAQFWPHKNHANLLLAIKLLKEEYGIEQTVVFTGSEKGNIDYIKELAQELGISDQLYFPGFVTREELVTLYRNAFALSYLSCFGPENLPPLEAFALGCPVIASSVSGSEEQLADAAVLVDHFDPKDIAGAVKKLHDNPDIRNALIEKGRERATRFVAKDFIKGVFNIIKEFEPIRRCWGNKRPDNYLDKAKEFDQDAKEKKEIIALIAERNEYAREIDKFCGSVDNLQATIEMFKGIAADRDAMKESLSWRVTKPLRSLGGLVADDKKLKKDEDNE